MADKKIFCIGLTKTGTTSFNALGKSLGLNTHGYVKRLLLEYLDTGDIGPRIESAIDEHDAFDDWPWPFLYKTLLERFGDDALFVLTRRKSPEAWLGSIKRYSLSSHTQRIRKLTYGTDFPHGFEEHYLARYTSHLTEVRAHFQSESAMDRLVDVEVGDPLMIEAICEYLGVSSEGVSIPRSNPTRHRPRVARQNLVAINRTLLGLGKPKITMEEAGYVAKDPKPAAVVSEASG